MVLTWKDKSNLYMVEMEIVSLILRSRSYIKNAWRGGMF